MNLDSLRDRRPDLFPSRGPKKSKAELRLARRTARDLLRALDLNKTRGTGKARVWAARLAHYRRGLTALVFHAEILAQIEADPAHQLATTGGVEHG